MIVYQGYFMDFMVHLISFLCIGVYVRLIYNVSPLAFVGLSFLFAVVVTIGNHVFFPDLSVSHLFLRA
jgi:hypothetical protein